MFAWSLLLSFIVSIVAVLHQAWRYGNWKKQNIVVTVSCVISWFIPALMLFLMPLDVTSAFYNSCVMVQNDSANCNKPATYIPESDLIICWQFIYWSSLLLNWFILPLMKSYSCAGDFNPLLKLKSSLFDNAIYYGSYLLIFTVLLIYLLVKQTIPWSLTSLKILIITASNTWGLFLVIGFLGYGLVEIPRVLWYKGSPEMQLNISCCKLSSYQEEYAEEVDKIRILFAKATILNANMPQDHSLRCYLNVILERKLHFPDASSARFESANIQPAVDLNELLNYSLRSLTKLHAEFKESEHKYLRAKGLIDEYLRYSAELQDVKNNQNSNTFLFIKGIPPMTSDFRGPWEDFPMDEPFLDTSRLHTRCMLAWIGWQWKCRVSLYLYRVLAVILAAVSILFVWSECFFWLTQPKISVLTAIFKASAKDQNYLAFWLFSMLALGYLSTCVFYTVSQFRFFNYYRLVANHHSDSYTLLFAGTLLCRLTPSLCLNFLGLANLDNHLSTSWSPMIISNTTNSTPLVPVPELVTETYDMTETAYTRFMGHLDVIPFIARGFNVYFPILVLVLCLITLFRVGSRLLSMIGIPQIMLDPILDDGSGATRDGALILNRARMDMKHRFPRRFGNRDNNRSASNVTVYQPSSTQNLSSFSDNRMPPPYDHTERSIGVVPPFYNESQLGKAS